MTLLLLVVRSILAAVFLTAGVSKLADRTGSRQAMLNFGVPAPLAGIAAVLLPAAEIVIALALIPQATAWWGAVAALGLLLLFLGAIGYQLARGRRPECHCFGQLHSAPVGRATLVRNLGLTGLALLLAVQPGRALGPGLLAWMGALTTGDAVVLAVASLGVGIGLAQAWFVGNLVRQNGRLLLRLDAVESRLRGEVASADRAPTEAGLPVGSPAPAFSLPTLGGGSASLADLGAPGRRVLLLFMDPGCKPCNALVPEVVRWAGEHSASLVMAVVSRGSPEVNRDKFGPDSPFPVLLQSDHEVAALYRVEGTPAAVLVDGAGRIAAPAAGGVEAIRALVGRTVARAQPGGPAIGSEAPSVRLPDLEGMPFDLGERQGRPTVLLFWNMGCGFCRRMLPELVRWEQEQEEPDTGLVFVCAGTAEENRAMTVRSRVLLDEGHGVSRQYGSSGTPSAVLVEHGRIASSPAVGAAEVLALLKRLSRPATTAA